MIQLLLVDDHQELLEITRLFLEKAGDLCVDTAISASHAIRMLQEKKYDAIVSDYEMPQMDGISFLKQVRKVGHDKPFIIFTGRSREEVVIEALNSGADFYLQKGSDPKVQFAELKNMIKQAVMRKRVEEALLQSETNYRTLVESTDDSIYMVDRIGRYLFMNSHHKERLGIVGDEYKALCYEDVHSEEESERFIALVRLVIQNEKSITDEYERSDRFFIRKISPVKNSIMERTIAVTVVSTEVTKSRYMEEAFTRLDAQYSTLIESLNDSIYSLDKDLSYLYMNSHHKKRLAIPDDTYIGRTYGDYHDPESTRRVKEAVEQVLETRSPVREHNEQGDKTYIRTFSPVKHKQTGEIIGVVVVSIDPDER